MGLGKGGGCACVCGNFVPCLGTGVDGRTAVIGRAGLGVEGRCVEDGVAGRAVNCDTGRVDGRLVDGGLLVLAAEGPRDSRPIMSATTTFGLAKIKLFSVKNRVRSDKFRKPCAPLAFAGPAVIDSAFEK